MPPSTRSTIRGTSNLESHWTSMRWTRRWKDSSGRNIRKEVWQMENHDLPAVMRSAFPQDPRNLLLPSIFNLRREGRSLASSYVPLPPPIQLQSGIQEIYHLSNPRLKMPSEPNSVPASLQNLVPATLARRIKPTVISLQLCERWVSQTTGGIPPC